MAKGSIVVTNAFRYKTLSSLSMLMYQGALANFLNVLD
jgi:hypothetical protein